jgi:hypothetical protein
MLPFGYVMTSQMGEMRIQTGFARPLCSHVMALMLSSDYVMTKLAVEMRSSRNRLGPVGNRTPEPRNCHSQARKRPIRRLMKALGCFSPESAQTLGRSPMRFHSAT